jgi:hypothetical protein
MIKLPENMKKLSTIKHPSKLTSPSKSRKRARFILPAARLWRGLSTSGAIIINSRDAAS